VGYGLGCIRPRYADGRWLENFDCDYLYPDKSTPWWEAPFYEGSSRQYSTYVPQDPAGLIAKLGGRAGFVRWLDTLFDGGHYEQGNEPDILAPYLYIEAGRHDRTAQRVRKILNTRYKLGRLGLPGNDDAGAMSSWYVWSSMGIYPVAGTTRYYIGSPVFRESRIHLENGRDFVIRALSPRTRRSMSQARGSTASPWHRPCSTMRRSRVVACWNSTWRKARRTGPRSRTRPRR
jgi:putative alpha-1,2-mannosidase